MTANKCITASDTSRPPNSVDLSQSKTTPKPPSVAPPSGEHVMVNAVLTVNGTHHPPSNHPLGQGRWWRKQRSTKRNRPSSSQPLRKGRRCNGNTQFNVPPMTLPSQRGDPATLNGIQPPILISTGKLATGAKTNRLQLQNKRQRHALQDAQIPTSFWTKHKGTKVLPLQESRPHT